VALAAAAVRSVVPAVTVLLAAPVFFTLSS